MASVKITELSSSGPLTGAEVLPIVQGNETVKVTVQEIANLGGGGGLEGTQYVFVAANGTPLENATELLTKYELAKTKTSQIITTSYAVSNVAEIGGAYIVLFTNTNDANNFNYGFNNVIINNVSYVINVTNISPSFGLEFTGLPSGLSFTSISLVKTVVVKMTLILAPGEYDLNGQQLVVNDNLVNIISLTGNADVKLIGVSSFVAAMRIIANNILVKGIEAVGSYILIGDGLNNLVVENCKGGAYSFTSWYPNSNISGTFNNCIGGSDSFASYGGNLSGTFNNCIGGSNSFSPMQGQLSGTFNNCKGDNSSFSPMQGNIFGTFNNCTGGSNSFTGSGLYGTFENCKAEVASFTANSIFAVFNNCEATSNSFTGFNFNSELNNCKAGFNSFNCYPGENLSGTFTDCVAGGVSFGGTNNCRVSAKLINCQSGYQSFAGGVDSVFEGTAVNCYAESESFGSNPSSTITERIKGYIINCQIITGTLFPSSANFSPSGELAGCFDSSGFIDSRTL
jgi:hypothetical protein